MPTWRCPHCGTPQAEASRCWVCRRSSTSCATCRNFRHSIAAQIGYCGLDPRRGTLRGDEIRACWEVAAGVGAAEAAGHVPAVGSVGSAGARTDVRRHLEFVPVDAAPAFVPVDSAVDVRVDPAAAPAQATSTGAGRLPAYELWADGEV